MEGACGGERDYWGTYAPVVAEGFPGPMRRGLFANTDNISGLTLENATKERIAD